MKNKLDNKLKTVKLSAKLAVILLIIVLCFTMTACDPGSYQFSREGLADVVSIELINYDNPEQKSFSSWVPDHTSDLKPFDDSKMAVLETLTEDKISDFLDELCEPIILHKYFAYDSPNGICIKLTYSDGKFLIICNNSKKFGGYIGTFSPDGEVKYFVGSFDGPSTYTHFVNSYFETQL